MIKVEPASVTTQTCHSCDKKAVVALLIGVRNWSTTIALCRACRKEVVSLLSPAKPSKKTSKTSLAWRKVLVTKASNATSAVAASSTLNLQILWQLANLWCPKPARWKHLLDTSDSWGPAHELGHALLEPRWRWKFKNYERCPLGFCTCNKLHPCNAYEAAAMYVSRALLRATGNEFIADREINETTDYDYLEPADFKRAKALLRRKKLWPIPRTRRTLEVALKRRLGKPRGRRALPTQQPPAPRGSTALGMFQNLLFNPGAL